MAKRRAFTMIEMLVVVAILAVLAAILFPVFSRVKAAAKQTQCLSNLNQIGSAINIYMSEWDDVFPHAVDAVDKFRPEIWSHEPEFQSRIPKMPLLSEALQPFLQSEDVFHCPSDTGTDVVDDQPWVEFHTAPSMYATYKSSYFFRTEIAFKYFTSTRFKLPAEVNVLFDAAGHWHGYGDRVVENDPELAYKLRGFRYNNLYGDMHAKSLSFAQIRTAWSTKLD